jgi:hypothetical protein
MKKGGLPLFLMTVLKSSVDFYLLLAFIESVRNSHFARMSQKSNNQQCHLTEPF